MSNLKARRLRKFWKAPINRRLDAFEYRYKSSYPYLSGDTFRQLGEMVIDKSTRGSGLIQRTGPVIVYAMQTRRGEFLDQFFDSVLPALRQPYVLMTHNGMTPNWGKYERWLESEQMLAWFGKNLVYDHPKAHTLPLGIVNLRDPHERGRTNQFWNELRSGKVEKDILCYVNIGVGHIKQARYETRLSTIEYFSDKEFATTVGERSWNQYAAEMKRSKFVVAPPGEALDTFRLWEALYLGSIPIVTSTELDAFYKNFPVWIVDSWEEVTEQALEQKWAELSLGFDSCPQLWASHWFKKITSFVE
ncbi:MAG: hypothetical protein ACMVP2_23015 [Imperialibacter sp.]|uniref:hypothetical protein n=1 Tax=Imperialibacter sp. TaxID=2038411 RepID=UPI003A866516